VPAKDIKKSRLTALCERRGELIVKMHELCLEVAKVELEILRAGGSVGGGPIAGTIGGTIAGTIGGTIGAQSGTKE
jgi:hypothetical protein